MKRFILLSFVFMAIGFYELSGGADFNPESARLAAVETRQDREAARFADMPGSVFVAAAPPDPQTEETVSRSNLNLVSFASVVTAPETPQTVLPVRVPQTTERETPSDISVERLAATQDEPLSLAALTAPEERPGVAFAGTSSVASSTDINSAKTLRYVKGTRVNMRSGPGTDYDVVAQLTQSAEVEVLADGGNGWVELRPLEGGPTGWVAEFLLTGG